MKKILIIEDDEFLGNAIFEKVQKEGFETVLETDGAVGLRKMSEFMPDLILMDMMLPTFNGYEILEAKKEIDAIKDIPVMVISNSGQEVEINKIKDLGVKEYIIKVQFSPKEVVEKINKILSETEGTLQKIENNSKMFESPISKAPRLVGKKILIVEDDAFLGDLLTKKLIKEGADITHSISGEDGLNELKNKPFDLISLDIVLPGISGLDTLKEISKDEKLNKIPVVILSNLSQKEDAEKAMKMGAKEFLVKSLYTLDEIIEKMKAVLENFSK
jgi:DNA-binding response OmpR family regulator